MVSPPVVGNWIWFCYSGPLFEPWSDVLWQTQWGIFPGQGAFLKVMQRWWLWEDRALVLMEDSQVAHMGFLGTILSIGTGYI